MIQEGYMASIDNTFQSVFENFNSHSTFIHPVRQETDSPQLIPNWDSTEIITTFVCVDQQGNWTYVFLASCLSTAGFNYFSRLMTSVDITLASAYVCVHQFSVTSSSLLMINSSPYMKYSDTFSVFVTSNYFGDISNYLCMIYDDIHWFVIMTHLLVYFLLCTLDMIGQVPRHTRMEE